ncbi:MAG: glycoside hydrolase family 140 protein [Kiritimatiellae bacterium]|nr:glycoside hydrolase family 140 protein [Kiritimatiellia bacterium]
MQKLRVSENGHFLTHPGGTPFFWMGDTGWGVFNLITADEAREYLENRKRKGFNLIQTFHAARWMARNRAGEPAFIDDDPRRPNPAHLDHIDAVLRMAESLDLYVAFGVESIVRPGIPWAVTEAADAYAYGRLMGERFRARTNVVWLLGHDFDPAKTGEDVRHLTRALAKGIADGVNGVDSLEGPTDYAATRMTYHPPWLSSSRWFHQDEWLDFHIIQTCANPERIADAVEADTRLRPPKPTLLCEGAYEDGSYKKGDHWVTPLMARTQAYWSVFAGGFGHTYGAHGVWRFAQEARPDGREGGAVRPWREAMELEAGTQMIHLRTLMESRPMLTRVPDQTLLACEPGPGLHRMQATRDAERRYALVYVPGAGRRVEIRMDALAGDGLLAWWYDPRTGEAARIGQYANRGTQAFVTPEHGPDWVLALDDAARGYSEPGRRP